jgi:uncharacterized protein YdcH (DUF465 family)
MSSQFLNRLNEANKRIGSQIERERSLLQPDHSRLSKLKKLRLSLRDRMARVRARAAQT